MDISFFSEESLEKGSLLEKEKFTEIGLWLKKAFPSSFFDTLSKEEFFLIVHGLMGMAFQSYFTTVQLKDKTFVLSLDTPKSDHQTALHFSLAPIKSYRSFSSNSSFLGTPHPLKISLVKFFHEEKNTENASCSFFDFLPENQKNLIQNAFKNSVKEDLVDSFEKEGHCLAISFVKAPQYRFIHKLLEIIENASLSLKNFSFCYSTDCVHSLFPSLLLFFEFHEKITSSSFIKELMIAPYFIPSKRISEKLHGIENKIPLFPQLLLSIKEAIHQTLTLINPHFYSLEAIEEDLFFSKKLLLSLYSLFKKRLSLEEHNEASFQTEKHLFLEEVEALETGDYEIDERRKTSLKEALRFIECVLKTNFFEPYYQALSFRLSPSFLQNIPNSPFKALPQALFFIKGPSFFAFHIRFQDLSRGGLRTVMPEDMARIRTNRNHVLLECYHLSITQDLKNKDIPEGGAKGVIFLNPYPALEKELHLLKPFIQKKGVEEKDAAIAAYEKEEKKRLLSQSQKIFIKELLQLVNFNEKGHLKASFILDLYKKPEYLFLGPDENMSDTMIDWIARYSEKVKYAPMSAFISGKPHDGINHKEWGVTSLGLHTYLKEGLKFLSINPYKEPFTLKMAGGPDGDVAGNEILNLAKDFKDTAKMLCIRDATGLLYDPLGLDLEILASLFHKGQGVTFYPPTHLSYEGFLLQKEVVKQEKFLLLKKVTGNIEEVWLSSNEMNHLLRTFLHETKATVFIPAGGRPKTLCQNNIEEFLDNEGHPTSKLIVEGANLYLSKEAREILEEKGTLILKDSSANKTGVISSSFEVLSTLILGKEIFLKEKEILTKEILTLLEKSAFQEASLLFALLTKKTASLTFLSDAISLKMNILKKELNLLLEEIPFPKEEDHPWNQILLHFVPPLIRTLYKKELFANLPEKYKKAIVACYFSKNFVYEKGIEALSSAKEMLKI